MPNLRGECLKLGHQYLANRDDTGGGNQEDFKLGIIWFKEVM